MPGAASPRVDRGTAARSFHAPANRRVALAAHTRVGVPYSRARERAAPAKAAPLAKCARRAGPAEPILTAHGLRSRANRSAIGPGHRTSETELSARAAGR